MACCSENWHFVVSFNPRLWNIKKWPPYGKIIWQGIQFDLFRAWVKKLYYKAFFLRINMIQLMALPFPMSTSLCFLVIFLTVPIPRDKECDPKFSLNEEDFVIAAAEPEANPGMDSGSVCLLLYWKSTLDTYQRQDNKTIIVRYGIFEWGLFQVKSFPPPFLHSSFFFFYHNLLQNP